MQSTARQIGELESKLSNHLAIKDSFIAGKNWGEKKAELENQLFDLKMSFYNLQIKQLEDKKAYLKKEREKVKK